MHRNEDSKSQSLSFDAFATKFNFPSSSFKQISLVEIKKLTSGSVAITMINWTTKNVLAHTQPSDRRYRFSSFMSIG